MRRLLASIFVITLCFNVTGCGTIFHGTHQQVPISVGPTGTEVTVYSWSGEVVGGPKLSPGELTVNRPKKGQSYLVRASKEGYCPKYWLTTSSYTAGAISYIWIIPFPLIGTVLGGIMATTDGATGGCCAVEPKSFEGTLAKEEACAQ